MTARKKKPRARPWVWTPGPGDPDVAHFLAAIREEFRATKAAQSPGPRSLTDLAAALGMPYATLRARLVGLRPLTWADAQAIAEAVGVALPPHHGSGSGSSTPG